MEFEIAVREILLPKLSQLGFSLHSITQGERETALFSKADLHLTFRGIGRLDDGEAHLKVGDKLFDYSDLIQKYCSNINVAEFREHLGGWRNGGLKSKVSVTLPK
jgi:hypothetical protein